MNIKHNINKRSKPAIHELQFNVAQLLKEATGATRHHDVNSQLLAKLDTDINLVAPINGQIRFLRTGSDILVTGVLASTVQKHCDRCLAKFAAPISLELEEQFYPTIDILTGAILELPEEADEANRINEHHILDLYEVVRQGFLLESSGIRYCQPDCRGLCPVCGRDRNVDPCTCEEEIIDPRWAALQAIQIEEE